jgi:hypothetical protein
MYVKMLDGRNAGEVRDIDNATALALLKNGRAAKAFADADTESAPPRVRAGVLPAAPVTAPGFDVGIGGARTDLAGIKKPVARERGSRSAR